MASSDCHSPATRSGRSVWSSRARQLRADFDVKDETTKTWGNRRRANEKGSSPPGCALRRGARRRRGCDRSTRLQAGRQRLAGLQGCRNRVRRSSDWSRGLPRPGPAAWVQTFLSFWNAGKPIPGVPAGLKRVKLKLGLIGDSQLNPQAAATVAGRWRRRSRSLRWSGLRARMRISAAGRFSIVPGCHMSRARRLRTSSRRRSRGSTMSSEQHEQAAAGITYLLENGVKRRSGDNSRRCGGLRRRHRQRGREVPESRRGQRSPPVSAGVDFELQPPISHRSRRRRWRPARSWSTHRRRLPRTAIRLCVCVVVVYGSCRR